ncbi:DUF1559 domain-containing protein [Crateriforma conspicua]|uniref:DUF1559 family PulG-like putative transporter n=1 Tax=Crateriforma TaxID=2714592 RepID=UPI0018CEA1A9|nr:DUF1559 domain-containing protein [Crateriforma conspicua]
MIELISVIAIVGILTSLLLPAVQATRERARSTQCQNRLRQIGHATAAFHSKLRHLPSNGGAHPKSFIVNVDGTKVIPQTILLPGGRVHKWGMGSVSPPEGLQTGPWCYQLFQSLELSQYSDVRRYPKTLPAFSCVSRSRDPARATVDKEFARYVSGGRAIAKTDFAANHKVIRDRPAKVRFRDVTDGLSNTLLVGEKAFDPKWQSATDWYWDEPVYIGGSKGTARDGHGLIPDGSGLEFRNNWGSPHPDVVHFVFCDGSVRLITRTVDVLTFFDLLTPQNENWVPQLPSNNFDSF